MAKQKRGITWGRRGENEAKHGLLVSQRAIDSAVKIQAERIETFSSFKLHRLIRFKQ